MNFGSVMVAAVTLYLMMGMVAPVFATDSAAILEQSMSETLDLWREGRHEQLFDRLSHRGKTSRESFVKKMHDTNIRPACCWQKMENFKVLNEKRTEATVYVKVGLDGSPGSSESITREFKLSNEGGIWRMRLSDIFSIAGVSGKKGKHSSYRSRKTRSPYHN